MFYLDTQRTATRRDSSLIRRQSLDDNMNNKQPSLRGDSVTSLQMPRDRGTVRKEIVTLLFEAMLSHIVKSWDTIEVKEEQITAPGKSMSEVTVQSKKKKLGRTPSKTSKKTSRIKMVDDITPSEQSDPLQQVWWSSPDERAVIQFRNGNKYEGEISMKCMHGEGRFQWRDGTIYMGNFYYNEIRGKGTIWWKDDTWYEGDLIDNIRHGKGIYVNSRQQRSYTGEWELGTKHGKGVIYYDGTFKNNYDGEWVHNVRHGHGAREYDASSGYDGEWDRYVRDGKGLMIWSNHDFYIGQWVNGVMSGQGTYVWDAHNNDSFALPVINTYRGDWLKGKRTGRGTIDFGLAWGAYYSGTFCENMKHGSGTLVTNNGLILHDQRLFDGDVMSPARKSKEQELNDLDEHGVLEPYHFDISDPNIGLRYHIEKAYENLDRVAETRAVIINEFIENNRRMQRGIAVMELIDEPIIDTLYNDDAIDFEEVALRNAISCYESRLQSIYYHYAQLCCKEPVNFTPVLTRLLLWQFYWDCNIHKKGLSLVEIDNMFHANPLWLSKSPHNPFHKIYYWQFRHSLISIASKLYAKRELPGPRPDTIVATAFRKFMDEDAIPGCGRHIGYFSNGMSSYIPLKALYALYLALGEPLTVRKFISSIRRPPHCTEQQQTELVEGPEEPLLGSNVYVFGDRISFAPDEMDLFAFSNKDFLQPTLVPENNKDYLLFNFANLSTLTVLRIFSNIFPKLMDEDKILDLNIEMTFLEFFEGFVQCAEESIRVKDEEIRWREMLKELEQKQLNALTGNSSPPISPIGPRSTLIPVPPSAIKSNK